MFSSVMLDQCKMVETLQGRLCPTDVAAYSDLSKLEFKNKMNGFFRNGNQPTIGSLPWRIRVKFKHNQGISIVKHLSHNHPESVVPSKLTTEFFNNIPVDYKGHTEFKENQWYLGMHNGVQTTKINQFGSISYDDIMANSYIGFDGMLALLSVVWTNINKLLIYMDKINHVINKIDDVKLNVRKDYPEHIDFTPQLGYFSNDYQPVLLIGTLKKSFMIQRSFGGNVIYATVPPGVIEVIETNNLPNNLAASFTPVMDVDELFEVYLSLFGVDHSMLPVFDINSEKYLAYEKQALEKINSSYNVFKEEDLNLLDYHHLANYIRNASCRSYDEYEL